MPRHRLWLVPFLFAVLVAGAWYSGVQSVKGDRELPVYVQGAVRLAVGEEIYRRGTDAKPFTYPPFAAVPFLLLRLAPEWQPRVWFAVNLAILLGALYWLHRWAGSAWPGFAPPRLRLLWLLVALLVGRHVASVFENQSHDLLVFAATGLCAGAWARNGRYGCLLAGAAAGLGAAIKATPLLFAELFVVRRAWTALGTLVGAAALLTWMPDLGWPRADGQSWAGAWYRVNLRGLDVGGTAAAPGAWDPHSILNQSLSGTLTRLLSAPATSGPFVRADVAFFDWSPGLLRAVIVLAQLLVVAAIGWGVWRTRRAVQAATATAAAVVQRRLALGECGLVLCGMVLLSPQSSKAHFCVLLLPAVFCVDQLLRTRRDLWLLLCLIGSLLLGFGTAKDLLRTNLGNLALGLGAVTWSTVLLLLGCLRALRPSGPAGGA